MRPRAASRAVAGHQRVAGQGEVEALPDGGLRIGALPG